LAAQLAAKFGFVATPPRVPPIMAVEELLLSKIQELKEG
jgi:hypothetical protein